MSRLDTIRQKYGEKGDAKDNDSRQYQTIGIDDMKEGGVNSGSGTSLEAVRQMRTAALVVSGLSILVSLTLGIAITVILMNLQNSTAGSSFAMIVILDIICSAVIMWRYSSTTYAAIYCGKRDHIASLLLSILFIFTGFVLLFKGIGAMAEGLTPVTDKPLYYICVVHGILLCILSISKFQIGRKLEGRTLMAVAFYSLGGGVVTLGFLVGGVTYHDNNNVWYLDALVDLVIAAFLLGFGVKLLWDACRDSEWMCTSCKQAMLICKQ